MLQTICICGAGTMGSGIAQVSAQTGFSTILYELDPVVLENAKTNISISLQSLIEKGKITTEEKEKIQARIQYTSDLKICKADVFIEAIVERPEIKIALFNQLAELNDYNCIFASNTSSLSVNAIAAQIKNPERVIGMHFFNPAPVMKLVEIINGYATKKEVTASIVELSKVLGKTPCVVNDYPGFVANRILMPMINEAITTLFEGVAGVEEIDTIMKLGMSHPMGPLQLADFIGLDTCLSILNVLYSGFGNTKYAPCPLLVNMVAAGKLGVKTGEGFYQYITDTKELFVSEQFRK